MAIVASLFGDLASGQNLQALIDPQLTLLYGQTKWRKYLDWGIPQTELTFATAIGRQRIAAAASITDPDSPAPLRSNNKLEKLEGGIPTMKEKFALNQADYRKLKSLEALPISDQAKVQALIKVLWNAVEDAATSPDRRIDIMFYQSISNFSVDISVLNNPDGVNFGELDLLAKPHQKRTVRAVWYNPDGTPNLLADPFRDIEETVTYASKTFGRSFSEIWIEQENWFNFKNHPAVRDKIAGYQNPGSNAKFIVTEDSINEYLRANKLPAMVIINERIGVEKDGVIQTINPFNVNNLVFVPAGKLGTLHNAISIESWEPVQFVNYANYDRTVVSKWRDNDPWREYTQAELHAFPALEQIDGIYLLQTDVPTV
ncbi:major capsid protein [Sphingobacterium anhuiense]|uniref:major capsid protein n=1 Tax=Sphingobacterium anhuiense TaxID=493780 RepID=UPI003C2C8B1C